MPSNSTVDPGACTEREITHPVTLCRADGTLNPQAVGWSRVPLHDCTLNGWGRNKRWDYWCVTADTPTSIIADKMGLTAPFKSAKETTNVFSQQAVAMAKDGKKTVAWDFVYIPSEEWKKNLKQALIAYAADNSKWDGVKNAFVDGWKTEKAASE